MQRDPRSPDSELPSTELRSDGGRISEPQGTQIWALYPAAPPPPEDSEASLTWLLRHLLAVARERRRHLALGALIGLGFGAAYLFFADQVYVVKALLHVEVRESLKPLLDRLDPREKKILLLRFFKNKTQSEIAAEIGVSQMHVSRLLSRTLEQLRASLEE